jgi:prepilin-type N-terminal cleavage/methylation domain-containing protein
MRGRPGSRPDDEGFSLIEVLVSLALLATTMAAMGPFFVRSMQYVARQRGQQAAIELANSAVEQVRALKGSSLLTGRSQNKSTRQWQTAFDEGPTVIRSYLDVPGRVATSDINRKLTMRLAWDTNTTDPTLGDDAAIPTASQTITVQTIAYTRTIFVGECDVYLENLPGYLRDSGDCVNPDVVPPPSDSTKDLKFYRAVVLLTWPDKQCPGAVCKEIASTLISRATEPTFDFHRPAPVVQSKTAVCYAKEACSFQLEAYGGQLPNTWSISGTLPAGLTLTPAGVLSGTPQTAETKTLQVTVTDDLNRTDTEPVTIEVVPLPSVTAGADLRQHVGDAVNRQLTAAGGKTPYTYTASGLPPGLSLNASTGAITGNVTTAGLYPVTVTVSDLNGRTGTAAYTHTVFFPVQLEQLADRTIALGATFTATAVAHGGDSAYTYAATGLPLGVTINSGTGAMSGLPTVPGRYVPTVTVTDGLNGTFSGSFVLVVTTSSSLIFTSPDPASADQTSSVGSAITLTLGTNADLLGLNPKFEATGLPDGLKLSKAKGTISGTPTTAGTYLVTVVAADPNPAQTSTLTFVWTIR